MPSNPVGIPEFYRSVSLMESSHHINMLMFQKPGAGREREQQKNPLEPKQGN